MSDKAIIVENLSKRYRIGLKEESHDTLGGAVASWVKTPVSNFRKLRNLGKFNGNGHADDVIWAVKDVSFEVRRGEVVGIIGRNGAGKSTLLKILSRITDPTSGKVIINGRVSSLLEVGTGFHQELTGRENVYLNGSILGMSRREIDNRFDEIIAFAEIGKFIDTPVKHYSSGMKVRLAFAVAAHLEPEILLVDEVLAVGDAAFQRKCMGKMGTVAQEGRTVLFVSHNMSAVQSLCSRCLYIANAGIKMSGDPTQVISSYLGSESELRGERYENPGIAEGSIVLRSAQVLNQNRQTAGQIMLREPFEIQMLWERRDSIPDTYYFIRIFDSLDRLIAVEDTRELSANNASSGIDKLNLLIDPNRFTPGIYKINIGCYKWRKGYLHNVTEALRFEVLNISVDGSTSKIEEPSILLLDARWEMTEQMTEEICVIA